VLISITTEARVRESAQDASSFGANLWVSLADQLGLPVMADIEAMKTLGESLASEIRVAVARLARRLRQERPPHELGLTKMSVLSRLYRWERPVRRPWQTPSKCSHSR
jgi:hypothetical protein